MVDQALPPRTDRTSPTRNGRTLRVAQALGAVGASLRTWLQFQALSRPAASRLVADRTGAAVAPVSGEAGAQGDRRGRRHVLILVENLPVPFDRRVWQEANALHEAGYAVSVICPTGKGFDAPFEIRNGIEIHRHPLVEASRARDYPREYLGALAHQLRLSIRVHRRQPIDIIQACNPPDLLFLVALVHKTLFGTRFVFDHHDLSPELYATKFGRKDVLYRILCFLERRTFRLADASIATNEVFREIAVKRGGMDPREVFVVKSYPELARFQRTDPDPALAGLGHHVVGYLGIMGEQDGVDILLRAMAEIVHGRGRGDFACVVIGDGPQFQRLGALSRELGVDGVVRFTGYLSGSSLMAHLSALEIGVIPDPPNEFNRKLSMNKVFEYMMLGLPFVQFDLDQARREAGAAALVARRHSPEALADAILALADNAALRQRMAKVGLARAARDFRWSTERTRYLAAYEAVFSQGRHVHDQRYHPAS